MASVNGGRRSHAKVAVPDGAIGASFLLLLLMLATPLLPTANAQTDSNSELRLNVNSILLQTRLLGNVKSFNTISDGWWGRWLGFQYCTGTRPDGTLTGKPMTGFQLRYETPCGSSCDDTALNGLRMACSDLNTVVTVAAGWFGGWSSSMTFCPAGKYITGARLRLEAQQGNGDDTGANSIEFLCSDGSVIRQWGGAWGDWSAWVTCPSGTFACGAEARVEDNQGNGDDTAFNGLRLACCSKW